ncbi:hypothetical protein ACJEI5_23920, partial [Escherichia coli]
GTVCVVGKMRDLILQLSKSSIYSTKPHRDKRNQFLATKQGKTITDFYLSITIFGLFLDL